MDMNPDTISSRAPSLSVSELKFSDGTILNLDINDTVVLVGPNNSGKSMTLRQIESGLAENQSFNVIQSMEPRKIGDASQFTQHVKEISQRIFRYQQILWVGYKYEIRDSRINSSWTELSAEARDFFVLRVPTDTRLSGSDATKSIAYRYEPPSHPMHAVVLDRDVERKIGELFHQAFGKYLYVNRAGGADVELFVGNKSIVDLPSDPFSTEAMDFFRDEALTLKGQGDGMRAFATISLNTIAVSQQTVLLIDEPEAFLHPPQARLIGRTIADKKNVDRQIFVATHSSDVMRGIIEGSKTPIKIVRMTRSSSVNHIKMLRPDQVLSLAKDPLARYSGVLDSIFYKHVVICESDTDCQFYRAILDTHSVSGDREPDVLFVQASGKHRMVKLADIAQGLGVPFSMIVDVDILNEKVLFKAVTESVGIKWSHIENHWKSVFDAVSAQKVRLTPLQLISSIEETVARLRNKEISVADFVTDIRDRIKSNSPWDQVKRAGRSGLPPGKVVETFDALLRICGESGLWIVPVGELEGFCRSITNKKGSEWIVDLLEKRDINESSELIEARAFVSEVWGRIEQE
jgi:energy-coupling factor transporter ATP-binding protein EcfA2